VKEELFRGKETVAPARPSQLNFPSFLHLVFLDNVPLEVLQGICPETKLKKTHLPGIVKRAYWYHSTMKSLQRCRVDTVWL